MDSTREDQATLFDLGTRKEPRHARDRRLNRERQTRWRRRHQFCAPVTDDAFAERCAPPPVDSAESPGEDEAPFEATLDDVPF